MKRKHIDEPTSINRSLAEQSLPPAKHRRRDSYIISAATSISHYIRSFFNGPSTTVEELVVIGIDVNASSLEEEENSTTPNNSFSGTNKIPLDSKSSLEEKERASVDAIPVLPYELIAKILDYIPSQIQTRQVSKGFKAARNYLKLGDLREVRPDFIFNKTFTPLPCNYHIEGVLEERLHFIANKEMILKITKNEEGEINEAVKRNLERLEIFSMNSLDYYLLDKVLEKLNMSIILSKIGNNPLNNPFRTQLKCDDLYLTRFPDALLTDEKLVSFWNKINTLTVSGNKLKCLPENIRKITNLKFLNAMLNQLSTLPTLPNSLEVLAVSYNQLSSLPQLLPTSLLTLEACDNQLVRLPQLPPSLKVLYVSYNQLSEEPKVAPGCNVIAHSNPFNLKGTAQNKP